MILALFPISVLWFVIGGGLKSLFAGVLRLGNRIPGVNYLSRMIAYIFPEPHLVFLSLIVALFLLMVTHLRIFGVSNAGTKEHKIFTVRYTYTWQYYLYAPMRAIDAWSSGDEYVLEVGGVNTEADDQLTRVRDSTLKKEIDTTVRGLLLQGYKSLKSIDADAQRLKNDPALTGKSILKPTPLERYVALKASEESTHMGKEVVSSLQTMDLDAAQRALEKQIAEYRLNKAMIGGAGK
jgi:hypothetical protein